MLALNEVYEPLHAAGVELVVLSPQSLSRARKQATAENSKKNVYLNAFKLDIPALNEAAAWQLPIPARFIIDTNGIIRDAKANPDYRFRPEPSELLDFVNRLQLVKRSDVPNR